MHFHPSITQRVCLSTGSLEQNDAPFINHLVMREFMSGPPKYHLAEEILRSYGFWDILPSNTPMKPTDTGFSKNDCDPNPKPDFHHLYCGFVISLVYLVTVYLVTITCLDLVWSYSELSKYVQFPGIAHMKATEHVLQHLYDTWNESITYTRGYRNPIELWGWIDADWASDTDICRSHTGYILLITCFPISLCLPLKPNSSPSATPGKRLSTFVKPSKI